MKLFLLRHGKAKEGIDNQKDFDRGLAEKGFKQSKKIGKYLKNSGISYAIVSSAKRTMETFDSVNKYLNIEEVYESKDLYLASSETINNVINTHVTEKDVMVVGHNYGISDLVDFYTGIDITLSTGMVAIIEFDVQSSAHFSRYAGRLIEVITPKTL
ncbi:MAG: histidine phosphatase family protein [Putridiphycobacter sp.]|nr:histidine phosphatase family protein [Putridiphycobacter sp.]